ncbi:putative phosphoribosyl transferase [Cupriavidus plantarum]|nr:putative phosphoribosyl transferase [Cupriavidus plantarum]RLK31136.1 putative phosphoribosyl transferase [Cupriavidus plantarum]CAG2146593.1 Putative phosphoribosyl transferase [Cupriavidus plantarum]SMR86249.1 putative phosphoribosyl transferase [Cupriavidus plantarum]
MTPPMMFPPCFADRREAGHYLGSRLAELGYSGHGDLLVLALPRGGVPVGFEVARALEAALDVLLVRKIGAPGYPELALGAVVEGSTDGRPPYTVTNDATWARRAVESGMFAAERGRQLDEICRRQQQYRQGRPVAALAGRRVIVVDDGVATGATMRAALASVRAAGAAEVVAAVPVGAMEGLASLADVADIVISLNTPPDFGAVGAYYLDFTQTSDEEAMALMREAARWQPMERPPLPPQPSMPRGISAGPGVP